MFMKKEGVGLFKNLYITTQKQEIIELKPAHSVMKTNDSLKTLIQNM